ncbi:MAG: recombinase family protein [Candidatus Faecousia sp.]|nr:recombinase family protein [Candidatus Faecousia sp.]
MSANRRYPFGYAMKDGKIRIVPEEAEVVEMLYSGYLAGETTTRLAEQAQDRGVSYHQGNPHWNKNMVCRILDHAVYLGEKDCPALITPQIFQQVQEKRRTRTKGKINPEIKEIRGKVRCAKCGSKMLRVSHGEKIIQWQCKTCGSCTRPLPDEELQQAVTTILHEITRHPERLTPPKRREDVEMEVIRLKRELQQLMEHDRTSTDQLLEMSKTLAEKRYASCGNPQISQTRNAKNLLESSQSQGTDTDDLLRWIVKNILLRADGAVQLRFINDQIIE